MVEIIVFVFTNIFLGAGLAMDAFSVSVADGLSEKDMKVYKTISIAGTFALFQMFMPLAGWFFVHTLVSVFSIFNVVIPYIALILLGFIGIKMIVDTVKNKGKDEEKTESLGIKTLMLQGVATSIDALSVGFTISGYNAFYAFLAALIIGVVTFGICMVGLIIGKKIGSKVSDKAGIVGGVILVLIGIEIFVKSFFL